MADKPLSPRWQPDRVPGSEPLEGCTHCDDVMGCLPTWFDPGKPWERRDRDVIPVNRSTHRGRPVDWGTQARGGGYAGEHS